MYKNFNLTEEERQQIIEQHKSYGYRQPLNEQWMNEQIMNTVKKYFNKGANMLMGKTGNKFWDAANAAKLGEMKDGNGANQKMFCMDDSCEDSIIIFSDGRVIFERLEFNTRTPGSMMLNPDGTFIFKWKDGTTSQKFKSK